MSCQLSNNDLRDICRNLSHFEQNSDWIIVKNTRDKITVEIRKAPSGFWSFLNRFFKPLDSRYSTVSETLLTIFEKHESFFLSEGRGTLEGLKPFLIKNADNRKRIDAIIKPLSSSTASINHTPENTALNFRRLAATQGDCLIECKDGALLADSCMLNSVEWFKRMIERRREKQEQSTTEQPKDTKGQATIVLKKALEEFSMKTVDILLDLIYLGKTREVLSEEEEWDLYYLQDYIGEGSKSDFFKHVCLLIAKMESSEIIKLLLEDHPRSLEIYLLQTLLERLRWWKPNEACQTDMRALFKKAKNCVDDSHWISLQAHCRLKGIGTKKDVAAAVNTLRAFEHYPPAASLLGYCYDHGIYVKKDPEIAATYYARAAHNGDDAAAHYNLALYFTRTRSTELAIKHLRLAVNKRFVPAVLTYIKIYSIDGDAKARLLDDLRAQGWNQ